MGAEIRSNHGQSKTNAKQLLQYDEQLETTIQM